METNVFSQSSNLGTLIAEHPANPRAQRQTLQAGWGLIAVGAVFALIGLLVSKGEWPDLLVAAAGLPVALIGVVAPPLASKEGDHADERYRQPGCCDTTCV